MTDSDVERIVALEINQEHMAKQIDHMSKKVDEMHEVLLQAKGAKWAIIGVASLAGFLASKLSAVAAFLGR
jgi:hypothetical protein